MVCPIITNSVSDLISDKPSYQTFLENHEINRQSVQFCFAYLRQSARYLYCYSQDGNLMKSLNKIHTIYCPVAIYALGKIFSLLCSFKQSLQNYRLVSPFKLAPTPRLGNPRSATGYFVILHMPSAKTLTQNMLFFVPRVADTSIKATVLPLTCIGMHFTQQSKFTMHRPITTDILNHHHFWML